MKPYEASLWNFGSESRLVVLTGAGVSAESGLSTFRDAGGLWEKHRVVDVCTPEALERNPSLVIGFYNERRAQLPQVQPNPAHQALARLADRLGSRMLLVTQNVDDLHERAGHPREHLLHMHGQLLQLRCTRDESHVVDWQGDQAVDSPCPICHRGTLRPNIVFFGEIPLGMERIEEALGRCTHFAYIGTSSQVYPAAGFKAFARQNGACTLCLNLEVESDSSTDLFWQGKAGTIVPEWVDSFSK